MKRHWFSFNIYLLLAMLIFASCKSADDEDKAESTLAVHLGTVLQSDGLNQTMQNYATNLVSKVDVYRANPVSILIEKQAFLNTADVLKAAVVEDWGGFHVEVELDRRASLLLESISASNVGRRLVIYSLWNNGSEGRWLAAPLISNRIGNGIFTFVPDASREEIELLVLGLNNVAKEVHKENRIFSDKWELE